ncbi:MAG: phosphotransferase [Chloroflexota bacterium]|nr:phosphotransferase [Chloroflexota bacterium]
MSPRTIARVPSPADLTDPYRLGAIFGPVDRVERGPRPMTGLSGATLERILVELQTGDAVKLVVKRVWPARDWTAYRTRDTQGREALLLGEPALREVWDCFPCPYFAFALGADQAGLLMGDLGEYIMAEAGGPLSTAQEDAFLRVLATMHARFWDSEALDLPWLATPEDRFGILGPAAADEEFRRSTDPPPIFHEVRRGWEIALARVTPPVRELLLRPADHLAGWFVALPRTLLHGDAKIGNCAFLPSGRVTAFDWAGVGWGPATFDIGYYLAVNGSRLARPREQVLERYRRLLQESLGRAIGEPQWEQLEAAAVLAGAMTLLWSKALALDAGINGAEAEWRWWTEQLARLP